MTTPAKEDFETVRATQERAQRFLMARLIEKSAPPDLDQEQVDAFVAEALTAHAEMPTARARIADLERELNELKFKELIVKAKGEHKLTPHTEQKLRAAFSEGRVNLASVAFLVEMMTPIEALKFREHNEPPVDHLYEPGQDYNGKTWAEMKPAERAELSRSNPERYRAMRSQALRESR